MRISKYKNGMSAILFCVFLGTGISALAAPVQVTILHTNDLHSHFREERGPLQLGGVARLSSAIQKVKKTHPHTILVDGGDWSEGNIYYNEGAGVESVKMMDSLGYDFAVVGNHDWLNGPDALLNIMRRLNPRTKFLSANLKPDGYSNEALFKKWVLPYGVQQVNGVKVAFIGLSTYEMIYDRFIAPITIDDPRSIAQELSEELKDQKIADVVVVISHNSISENRKILLEAPAVDLIVGAHDHVKLTEPIIIEREDAKPGWIVEAGSWGAYLGQVDLTVDSGNVSLKHYKLIQIDSSLPEDPKILAKVQELEGRLEKRYGPIFHDHVGVSELELSRKGLENDLGNLEADAFFQATHPDIAVNCSRVINGALHEGEIRTVDVFNADPAVYNPATGKSWTLKIVPMSGRKLKWILYAMYATKKLSAYGLLNVSGMSFVYDPLFLMQQSRMEANLRFNINSQFKMGGVFSSPFEEIPSLQTQGFPVVQEIRIQGEPLDEDRTYRVAMGQGMVEAVEFVNSKFFTLISSEDIEDTGLEQWRILGDYIQTHTPINRSLIPIGNRIRTIQPDLAVMYDDVEWSSVRANGNSLSAQVKVRVKNMGATESDEGAVLKLMMNQNYTDYSRELTYLEIGDQFAIPALAPGESKEFKWNVQLSRHQGLYPITAKIEGNEFQVDHTYDEVTRWFRE